MEKNNCIITYNQNGYKPVNKIITFEQKLKDTAKDIKATYGLPAIIMLQEILAGKNMKFLNLLKVLYPEHELILPTGFNYSRHYKSIMSVTLIRRDVLGSYRVVELDPELCNRTCYCIAELDGIETHILNVHMVQIQNFKYQADWYIAERKRLHEQQWNLLYDALYVNKEANVIFAGDMQESKSSANLKKIEEEGYIISGASGTKTVKSVFFKEEACIDYIILSSEARSALGKENEIIYDNSGVGKYSDHMLLCLCS